MIYISYMFFGSCAGVSADCQELGTRRAESRMLSMHDSQKAKDAIVSPKTPAGEDNEGMGSRSKHALCMTHILISRGRAYLPFNTLVDSQILMERNVVCLQKHRDRLWTTDNGLMRLGLAPVPPKALVPISPLCFPYQEQFIWCGSSIRNLCLRTERDVLLFIHTVFIST